MQDKSKDAPPPPDTAGAPGLRSTTVGVFFLWTCTLFSGLYHSEHVNCIHGISRIIIIIIVIIMIAVIIAIIAITAIIVPSNLKLLVASVSPCLARPKEDWRAIASKNKISRSGLARVQVYSN